MNRIYVWWYTFRAGNDGRRPSGIVHTQSKVHVLADAETGKTLCGITDRARYYEARGQNIPDEWTMCKLCEKKGAKP
jgi:hypothetical protein